MKTKTLSGILKLVSRISNPASLTSLYRAVEISPNAVRCCSEFGNIHILLDNTGVKSSLLLDCSALLAVTQSLPGESEITFEEQTNKIKWVCGDAKGSLNFIQTDYSVPQITHKDFPWSPPKDFANALFLAQCACQAAAVSIGLYGIAIEPDGDRLRFLSSNSISLASTSIEKDGYPGGKVTVRPPVPGIIAALLSACPNCTLDFTDEGIFIIGDWLMAHLPLGTNLEHDLKSLADKFTKAEEVISINVLAVKKFISRAKNLTDSKSNFTVSLKVEGGKLILTHESIGSSTEEWFLAEGLPNTANYQSVVLAADLLLLPLEFIQYVVLDYISEQQLVLRGNNPQFTYVLGGA